MVYCIFCIVLQRFIAYFALSCNGLLHILHCLAMVYCIFCIVLQRFIAYFALFCKGLLHILHCLAMVYCIFCIVLQRFIAYFALFCKGLLHILHCLAMVYCIFCIVLQWFIAYFALQVVAGVMQRQEKWRIEDADGVKAATALLPFTRPGKKLHVWLHDSTPTPTLHQLAATIKQTDFGGQLEMKLRHSRDNFIPCDDLVKDLVKDLHGAE